MKQNSLFTNISKRVISFGWVSLVLASIGLLIAVPPVLAHHSSGGKIPSSFAEGFLSGLGHPVIGIDHLVFVIAIGLLAALSSPRLGMILPGAFVLATAGGTGIHLQSISLPIPELVISTSVLVVGIFLAQKNKTNLGLLMIFAAIAGIFHGYAYGESIVGAVTTALGAYLLGFCVIQLGISAIAFYIGKSILGRTTETSASSHLPLRFAGFAVGGIGFAFLSSTVLG